MTIAFMLELAARSLALGLIVFLMLRVLRVRDPGAQRLTWVAVLMAAIIMPALVKGMEILAAGAQSGDWMPPAISPLVLRPLADSAAVVSPGFAWARALSAAYAVVAAILLLRVVVGWRRGRRLLKEAAPITDSWTLGADVRSSDRVSAPVTIGRTIVLPGGWNEWNAFAREAVIAHETAHVQRRDFYVHVLSTLHAAAFWFSPFSWWLKRRLLESAESAADDAAIRAVGDRASYCDLLVEFAGAGTAAHGLPMASGKTVGRRVIRLLDEQAASPLPATLTRSLVLSGSFGVALTAAAGVWVAPAIPFVLQAAPVLVQPLEPAPGAAAQQPVEGGQQSQPRIPTQATPAPVSALLGRWLEEEVPDIAADGEREAFGRLRDDAERETFINLFWLRRDPSPGTRQNEFRDEYYSRIEKANRTFSTTVPGWRTDRGRILIRYGDPDEKESLAMGGSYRRTGPDGPAVITTNFPTEKWLYRAIQGVGRNIVIEFVDETLDGNYRLKSSGTAETIIHEVNQPQTEPQAR